jgi:hypothetical protein
MEEMQVWYTYFKLLWLLSENWAHRTFCSVTLQRLGHIHHLLEVGARGIACDFYSAGDGFIF